MKVSLGLVLIIIIVVVAIVSGILALVPLLEASKSSSFDIAQDFAVTISERISVRVESVFDDLTFAVNTVQRAVNYSAIVPSDTTSILRWLGTITTTSTVDHTFFCFDNGTNILVRPSGSTTTVLVEIHDVNANTSQIGTYNTVNETFSWTSQSYATFLCLQTTPYSSIRSGMPWSQQFIDTAHGNTWTSVLTGAPLLNVSGSYEAIGAFGLRFENLFILDYLSQLDIAATGVAALMDMRNDTVIAFHIHDSSFEGTTIDSVTHQRVPWTISTLPNDLIQRSIASLSSSLRGCSTPCGFQSGSQYLNTLFIQVNTPYVDGGIELRLLLVIPSSDFLSSIQTSIVIGSCSAAGAIVVLASLSALLLFSCLRPLHELEQRLYAIAVLKEDNSSAPRSFLREIYNIEVAYSGMQSELIKMKSFLPQSVLRQLEEELAEEEEELKALGEDGVHNLPDETGGEFDDDDKRHHEGNPHDDQGDLDSQLDIDDHMPQKDQIDGHFTNNPISGPPQTQREKAEDLPAPALSPAVGLGGNTTKDSSPPQPAANFTKVASQFDGGLVAVNPLQVLSVGADHHQGDVETHSVGLPANSMRTEVVALAISVQRQRRANRPTLRSLNDLCVLSAKRITVAMANVVGFHQVLDNQGPAGIERFHSTLLEIVLHEVNTTSGVLDFVHGDRFLITYNASTSCLPHSICAAEMVVRVNNRLETAGLVGYQGIRFGVSAGEALCGNFGNDQMKRFSAVGPVVHQAFTLMQQTKAEEQQGSARNLVCASVFARIRMRYAAEHVNYVQLPGQSNAALISTIRGVRQNAESFDSILSRTKIGFRRVPAAAAAGITMRPPSPPRQSHLDQPPQVDDGMSPNTGDDLPMSPTGRPDAMLPILDPATEQLQTIDQINTAFETFSSGDIDGAKSLAESVPLHRSQALKKAFQVCE